MVSVGSFRWWTCRVRWWYWWCHILTFTPKISPLFASLHSIKVTSYGWLLTLSSLGLPMQKTLSNTFLCSSYVYASQTSWRYEDMPCLFYFFYKIGCWVKKFKWLLNQGFVCSSRFLCVPQYLKLFIHSWSIGFHASCQGFKVLIFCWWLK